MKKLVSSLIYILSLILILSFLVVFTTENTSIVSKLYKKDIIKSIQKSPSINYSFDNLSIILAFGTRVREDYDTSPSRKVDLNKILQNASFSTT